MSLLRQLLMTSMVMVFPAEYLVGVETPPEIAPDIAPLEPPVLSASEEATHNEVAITPPTPPAPPAPMLPTPSAQPTPPPVIVAPIVPEPITPPPAPVVAPVQEPASVPATPVKIDELAPKPLFSSAQTGATGADSTKGMYEKSEEFERKASEAFSAIESEKDKRLDAYMSFDGELDALYEEVGGTRGSVVQDIDNAREVIVSSLGENSTAAHKPTGALVAEQSQLLSKLETELKLLKERDAAVIEAVKNLSDFVLSLDEALVQLQSNRTQISSTGDTAIGNDLFTKIKETSERLTAATTAITQPSGQAKAVDDALEKAKAQVAAVRTVLGELKQKGVNLAELLKKAQAVAPQESSDEDAKAVAESEEPEVAKKKKNERLSVGQSLVKGTLLEKPYAAIACGLGFLKEAFLSIKSYIQVEAQEKLFGQPSEAPVSDPVLERIRVERNQSADHLHDLQKQHEVIEMKAALLDRLEAERIMQLDSKEDIAAHLDKAYARKTRELTWFELFKRFSWKLYATARRGVKWLWRSVSGGEEAAGRGEVKVEPKLPAAVASSAPSVQATPSK